MNPELRRRPIVKVGYQVPDLDAGIRHWAEHLGAGPFVVVRNWQLQEHPDPEFRFDHSSGFGRWGELVVEWMETHALEPAPLRERFSREGVHHVTWFAESLDQESAQLEKEGWPVLMRARTASGTDFVFHDATHELGHLVEIYERTPAAAAHYENIHRLSIGWDGSNPIRER